MASNAFHKLSCVALSTLLLASCGDVLESYVNSDEELNNRSFRARGNDDLGPSVNPKTLKPDELPPGANITWNLWPCESTDLSLEDPNDIKLIGAGPHESIMTNKSNFQLNLEGEFCPTEELGRNITFVIDVSESMRDRYNIGADPVVGGTCQRLESVRAVVNSLADYRNVQFALVTFDSQVRSHSGGFWPAANFLDNFALTSIVCGIGDSTSYRAGLEKAEEFFLAEESSASKEVYFVSDGLPLSSYELGEDVAERIQQMGMIATVMIGSNDYELRTKIASKNLDGEPLHVAISSSTLLKERLLPLTTSSLIRGYLTYEAIDSLAVGIKINLDSVDNSQFAVYNIDASREAYPGGILLKYRFWDYRSALYERVGRLVWIDE